MEYQVVMLNPQNGRFAVRDEYGELTVVDLVDAGDIAVNQVVRGDLSSHGSTTLLVPGWPHPLLVSVEGIGCSAERAADLVFR